ncbi:phage tail assembly chaperone [Burkholderia latens]|uniref:XkdW family protein n=1 Tax=Burkholderia latens TaxID=488446 RepID=UPI00158C713D|nr:phage tail assembly chaperone [Burkholderia latens]
MEETNIIDVEQAAFILAKKYPQLVRGRDYWVAHPVDEQTLKQTKTAWVPIWESKDIDCPTPEDLLDWWPEYSSEYAVIDAAERVRKKRDDLLIQADRLVEIATDAGNGDLELALRKYRNALRGIPDQKGFPLDVKWPEMPNA